MEAPAAVLVLETDQLPLQKAGRHNFGCKMVEQHGWSGEALYDGSAPVSFGLPKGFGFSALPAHDVHHQNQACYGEQGGRKRLLIHMFSPMFLIQY